MSEGALLKAKLSLAVELRWNKRQCDCFVTTHNLHKYCELKEFTKGCEQSGPSLTNHTMFHHKTQSGQCERDFARVNFWLQKDSCETSTLGDTRAIDEITSLITNNAKRARV